MEGRRVRRWKVFAATAAVATVALVGTALAIVDTFSAGVVEAVTVTRSTDASQTSAGPWVDVPGAKAQIVIPAGRRYLVIAEFTAESVCYGQSGWCSVRILFDGVPMAPDQGTDFAFDSHDLGDETYASWEAKAMDRSRIVGAYTFTAPHTVSVQYAVSVPGQASFRLDDWHLTVQRAAAT